MSHRFFERPQLQGSPVAGSGEAQAALLSVVEPCKNEEEGLRETHRRLSSALESAGTLRSSAPDLRPKTAGGPKTSTHDATTFFEIIYADDGSTDGTAVVLLKLQATDSCVRVVRLSRNFGHLVAISAGLSIPGILYALCAHFFAAQLVRGWTSSVIAVLFVGGVQLICLGIIGESVGRTYGESKRRPLYFVRDWSTRFDARMVA